MGIHLSTISVAVLDSSGKLVMESIIESKASTSVEFVQGLLFFENSRMLGLPHFIDHWGHTSRS
jgi:hypothetical protein